MYKVYIFIRRKQVVSVNLKQKASTSFEQNITKMAYNYSNSVCLTLWFGYVSEGKWTHSTWKLISPRTQEKKGKNVT